MLREFLLVGFLVIIILAIIYLDRAVGTRYRPDLRGPKGWPIIGNLLLTLEYGHDIHDHFYEKHLLYGKNLSYYFDSTFTIPVVGRFLACNYPEGVEYILKTNSANFPKGPVIQKLLSDFIGDGIFSKFATAFNYASLVLSEPFLNPLWPITEEFTTRASRMRNACKTARDVANDIIQSRRIEISKNEKIPNDLLSLCMNAIDEDGRQLNDNELIYMILNLILAGRDSTAQAITWMIYEIIKNPRVEIAILKEINSLLKESNQVPTYDSLHEFAYTTATFYESLRLHPSVPANVKTCLKDDVLPGGVPIYAGDMIGWSSYTMGRTKEIWGEDAYEFKPERFLKGKEISKPNPYKYPMFNAGPRNW
ncbi:hypothetical protein G9A89_000931 [Geosiphon pyriformis]|nr:hypothetical protein G9A89_000931 [Geosiphon pyriformis]